MIAVSVVILGTVLIRARKAVGKRPQARSLHRPWIPPRKANCPVAMERLYIRFKGRVLGPISGEKALEMVRRGQITRQHEVSADGSTWQTAASVPELFPARGEPQVTAAQENYSNTAPPKNGSWYANFDGSNQGPTDEEGIKQWIGMGKITRSTLVWREGMSNWAEAGISQPAWFVGIPMEPTYQVDVPYHRSPYDTAAFQPNISPSQTKSRSREDDEPSPVSGGMKVGIAILSFFVPLVGLIMGLIYMNDEHPDKKAAGKLWLLCAGIMISLNLLCCCVWVCFSLVLAGASR
jgi:hypothetical protein